jgi:hypothetical protein
MPRVTVPGQVAIVKCQINTNSGPIDLRQFRLDIRVYESMMRPYQIVEMHVIDLTNFGNTVRIEGGEELTLTAMNVYGQEFDIKAKAIKQTGEVSSSGLRAQGTQISFADDSYFRNRTTKVQAAYKNIPGSQVIAQISQQFLGAPISRLTASKGFIASPEPYIIHNKRPWDAIKQIRFGLTSAQDAATGAFAYYKDKFGMCLVPLAQAFREASPEAEFVQDGTVGKSFLDVNRLERQIIALQGGATFSGSFDPGGAVQAASGVTHSFDFTAKKFVQGLVNKTAMASGLPGVSAIAGAAFSALGNGERTTHYVPHDPNLRRQDPRAEKNQGEKLLGYTAQGAGAFTMMVLFDLGINLTVGRGVFAKLAPPVGDLTGAFELNTRLGGRALVINLCHHWKNYDSQPQGTTTIECSQGGFKQ